MDTVVIIKSAPWEAVHKIMDHPEYSAILEVVKQYESDFRFTLVGSSDIHTMKVRLGYDTYAWDIIKRRGVLGELTYGLQLMKLLFQYRPRIIIVLGLFNILPVAVYALFSRECRYIPVFTDALAYYGNKSSGRLLFDLGLKAFGFSLELSQRKILDGYAPSNYTREGVQRLAPSLHGKIALVSYPISPRFSRSIDQQIDCGASSLKEPMLLTVAGIERRKGLDTLIKAVSMIPKRFRLIIKGAIRDSDYMQRLNNMIAGLGIKDKVTFMTDPVDYDALISYYKPATIFVLPTREDCLGVVVLEALSCGVPVVATSVGGIVDMIENGANGILVQPDNPEELAKAISSLLDNPNLREKLARNAGPVLYRRYYRERTTLKEALVRSIKGEVHVRGKGDD